MARRGPLLVAAALWGCAAAPPKPGDGTLESRRRGFQDLLAEHWEYVLSRRPEYASILGDRRWNDKSSDLSARAVADGLARTREYLDRLAAVDATGFSEQEALTRALLMRELRLTLEEARFRDWQMPVNQMSGIHLRAPMLVPLLPFRTVKDHLDYAVRLRHLPGQLEDTMANMRLGAAAGLVPPRFLLEKVAAQAEAVASAEPEQTPFAGPLGSIPADISQQERNRIRQEILTAIRERVLPAYARFAAFVRQEYAPRGRADPGVWSLPDGEDRYAAMVRRFTTTDLSPEEIHRMGLAEVRRIEVEMLGVARRAGFSDLAGFRAGLERDPALRPRSREQILEAYRGFLDGMRAELPRLFGRLPRAEFVVVPVEEFREKQAAGAQYQSPSPDGSRPGRILVNTGDFALRKTITFESTAYHEGVPGHHLQIAIQQELEGLPPVRRLWLAYGAFSEGWALYAEELGKEVGRFQDPASDYGRLQDEMLRAIRLVVDTGLHAKRWTREQVVGFFRAHSSIDEVEIQAEADRYIAWPGQALAYKVGQLRILELRRRAREELGPRFDLRRFHDAVLGAGALPLDVLESRIGSWIAAEKAL